MPPKPKRPKVGHDHHTPKSNNSNKSSYTGIHNPKSKSKHSDYRNDNHTQNQSLSHDQLWDDRALIDSWNDAVREYEYYHALALVPVGERERVLREAEVAVGRGEDVDLGLELGFNRGGGGRDGKDEGKLDDGELDDGEVDGEEGEVDEGVEDQGSIEEGEINHDEAEAGGNGVADADDDTRLSENQKQQSKRKANGSNAHGKQHGPILPPPAQDTSASKSTQHFSDRQRHQHPSTQTQTRTHGASVDSEQTMPQMLENIKMAYYWAGYYSGLYDGQQQAQR